MLAYYTTRKICVNRAWTTSKTSARLLIIHFLLCYRINAIVLIDVVLTSPPYTRKLPIKYLNNRKTYKTGINWTYLLWKTSYLMQSYMSGMRLMSNLPLRNLKSWKITYWKISNRDFRHSHYQKISIATHVLCPHEVMQTYLFCVCDVVSECVH
jgi:hypothetical protein